MGTVWLMEYTLESLMAAVGCPQYPKRWAEIFDTAMFRFSRTGNALTEPSFYDTLQKKYGCMAKYLELYKKAAAQTAEDEALSRFLFLLAFALEDRENRNQDIRELSLLTVPEGREPLAYNMVTGLAVCSQLEEGDRALEAKGFPEAYRRSCLQAAVDCGVNSYMRVHGGQPGYRLLGWAQHYLKGKMAMIGRLEVEFDCPFKGHAAVYRHCDGTEIALAKDIRLHSTGFALGSRHYEDEAGAWEPVLEETETHVTGCPYQENGAVSREKRVLSKDQWQLVLTDGDPVISLHIPDRPGQPLTPEVVDSTLAEIEAVAKAIGYPYKAFVCHSWLLDPQLEEILGPETNMVRFSKRFGKLTAKSSAESVFFFAFKRPNMDFAISDLPENTRLERGVKQHYLNGKAIYEVFGYFCK